MNFLNSNLSITYPIQEDISDASSSRKLQMVENYVHISDRDVPPRAVAVLPPVLQFRRDCISPRRPLPSRVRFGPVKGVLKSLSNEEAKELAEKSAENKSPLFLLKTNQGVVTHIDHTDHDKANWLGLLPLGDSTTANVWIYEHENELYGITTKTIPSRGPLMLGYSSEYVKLHEFPPDVPYIDLHEALSSTHYKRWCYDCQRAMPSDALLQHHINIEHKNDKFIPHRKRRCQQCKRTFTRLFTLKRHMTRHCTKKGQNQPDTSSNTDKLIPNVETETNCLLDESRVPSEEILHNFTSSIDFNSLFDTYRSLDLSNGSKSADLIDPDNQLSRYDSALDNVADLNFINVSNNIDGKTCKSSSVVHEEPVQTSNIDCTRKTEMNEMDEIQQYKAADDSDIMYKCEDCQLIFKRRGMFVNHLWRVHGNVSARVPLERRVRRYPCAGCARVYRSAAKRDRHARNHHPGCALEGAPAEDRGRRACAAAACAACPRQYATRAKLLQHVRAAHPHIAPPLKKGTIAK